MEEMNKISDCFFLLKKRLREKDINELTTSSTKSLVDIMNSINKKKKESQVQKKNDKLKANMNITTIGSKLASLLENKKLKQKEKCLPAENLLNIAFDKNAITRNSTEKKENEEIKSPEIVQEDNIILPSEEKNMSDRSPLAVPMNDESDEEDKKGDIFDSNMLSSDLEVSSPEVKPFDKKTSPIAKEEKKDNIIVNNTKISIPLEFFGDDKSTEHKNPNSSKHNVISTLPKVKQKDTSSSVNTNQNIKSSPSIPKIKPPPPHIGPIKSRPQMSKENDSGIKKKEYDLVCLSMIDNLTTKMRTRYKPSPNSSILKEFNEIQKLILISTEMQKDKRIRIVTERCIKIISILCNIFEDDKKKEFYVNDVIQVLDVVGTFYHKAKVDFASIPFWFKMFKLAHKYVYSLFSLRTMSHSQLKEMIKMETSENKMKRLVNFAKVYKSYINSIDRLKMFLSKKGETTEDRKRKTTLENLIIYLETEPNAIKYGKCFKVSKRVIDLIIEYSSDIL